MRLHSNSSNVRRYTNTLRYGKGISWVLREIRFAGTLVKQSTVKESKSLASKIFLPKRVEGKILPIIAIFLDRNHLGFITFSG